MGATGSIMATRWTYVDPYIAFKALYSFMVVLMAAFGGMGQLYGPVVGAALFAYLEEILITKFPYYYMLAFGLILLIVIIFIPDGLAGVIDNWREKRKGKRHANP
jgi:branched-chain amino acid transport system permease protein